MEFTQEHEGIRRGCAVIPAQAGIHATGHTRLLGVLGPRLHAEGMSST